MDLNVSRGSVLRLQRTVQGTVQGTDSWCAYHRLGMQGDAAAVLDRTTCMEAEDSQQCSVG